MPAPRLVGVPDAPPRFVGRDALVERMAARLASAASLTLAAVGPGGVGKTSLAAAVAHHRGVHARFGDGVLWAALGTSPDPAGALNGWAGALGLRVTGLPALEDRAAAIREAIGYRRMLLVVDDVWDEDAAWLLQCGGPLCSYLFTTRGEAVARRLAGGRGVEVIPVLDEEASLSLLARWAPRACAAAPDRARVLAAAAQGLPLALEVLGGYLASGDADRRLRAAVRWFAHPSPATPAQAPPAELRAILRRAAGVLLGHSAPEREPAQPVRNAGSSPLEAAVRLSLHALPPESALAFYELGAFAPKPETFDAAAATSVAGPGAAELLAARGLLERVGDDGFALHPALAEVARTGMPLDAPIRHRLHYLNHVRDAGGDWRAVEPVYGQIKWAWDRLGPGQDRERLQLASWLVEYQRLRGLGREAVAWGEAATRVPPAPDRTRGYATVLFQLGWAYADLGLAGKALETYQRCLDVHRQAGTSTAAVLNNMGMVYSRLEEWDRALEYHERARAVREQDSTGIAITLSNIAGIYERLGRREEALEQYRRVVPLLESGGEWVNLGITLNNMGLLYDNLGEPRQAQEHYARAVALLEDGGDRANLALTLLNLGELYRGMGEAEAALESFERSLSIREEIGDHRGCVRVLRSMAWTYRELGQREKERECLRRAQPILQELQDRARAAWDEE